MYRKVFLVIVVVLVLMSAFATPAVNAKEPDLSFHEVYKSVHEGVVLFTSSVGSCSGWRWGNLIITNYHCVHNGKNFEIWHEAIGPVDPYGLTVKKNPKPTGKPSDMWINWKAEPKKPEGLPVHIVGINPDEDLAVLLTNDMPDGIISLKRADPATTRVGDLAFLMGWPAGLWPVFNMGVVSSVDVPFERYFPQKHNTELFIADMWVNGGNSGGPVLNIRGEVIGMACMSLISSGRPTGINLMVNIKHVDDLLARVIAYSEYSKRFVVVPPTQKDVKPVERSPYS